MVNIVTCNVVMLNICSTVKTGTIKVSIVTAVHIYCTCITVNIKCVLIYFKKT